jgi:hypothetical protein
MDVAGWLKPKGKTMTSLTVRVAILAGIGAIAMMVPAAASPTVSDSNTRPHAAATEQYAQDFSHGSRAVDYGYKSKKCKKSDKKCKAKTKPKSETKG